MGARRVVVYALGALMLAGFGVALWSVSDIANACDPTTGQGCPSPPSTQPLPGSANGPPAAQGPSVGSPNNQVQPGPDNGSPFIAPGAGAGSVPTSTPAPPPTTVAPVTPSPVSTSSSDSSGGVNGWAVGVGAALAAAGAALIARAFGTSDRPPTTDGLIGDAVLPASDTAVGAYNAIPIQAEPPVTLLGLVEENEGPPKK
jgi:hypothetical protein